jgi:hypothetical protein
MLHSVRDFVTSHNDVSKLVRDAEKFSVKVPVLGKISVPPPKHLAFYGVLGVLGATEVVPWPVAVGIGVGHALTVRTAGAAASAPAEADADPVQDSPDPEEVLAAPASTSRQAE